MLAFLQGLDSDLQKTLLCQLRDLWTHTSTALEGNTLTLGDTKFVIEEGLTVSGKPLKDHEEVVGHARAIDLLYSMLNRDIDERDLFDLHKAVQTERITDIYKPNGTWKVETNGTYAVGDDGKQAFIEYAQPENVPILMAQIMAYLNELRVQHVALEDAAEVYAKVHMAIAHTHPFWDGNGRVARLVSNIPILNVGLPPIVIPKEARRRYIEILSRYQIKVGPLTKTSGLWPDQESLREFVTFCNECYSVTKQLVEQANILQQKRRAT